MQQRDVHRLPPGRHADKTVPGLVLTVRQRPGLISTSDDGEERPYTGRYWSFRYRSKGGTWREVGLGSAYVVTLAVVRTTAAAMRELVGKGHAPVVPEAETIYSLSNRAVAKKIGVSPETMNRTRRQLEAEGRVEPRNRVTGLDGKTYPVRRSK